MTPRLVFREEARIELLEARRTILHRFPYQLLYYRGADDLVVLACYHHRRDPAGWRSRR